MTDKINNKEMWIRLEKKVENEMWSYNSSLNSFSTLITFKPYLRNKKNFIRGQEPCVYFNKQIEFELALGFHNGTHLQAEVTYAPKVNKYPHDYNQKNKTGFLSGWNRAHPYHKHDCLPNFDDETGWVPCEVPCKEYFWLFDRCLVKLQLKNDSSTAVLTRRLGMQCSEESRTLCGNHLGVGSYFGDPSFVSAGDLQSDLNYTYKSNENKFLTVYIEILAQLHLVAYYDGSVGQLIVDRNDENCLLENCEHFVYSAASCKPIQLSLQSNLCKALQQSKLSPGSEDCDFILKIGAGGNKILEVHKLVLSGKSPVFRAMFGKGWNEPSTGRLQMDENISLPGVNAFINFLYETGNSSSIVYSWDVLLCLEVLKLAHFYQVIDLIEYCKDRIAIATDQDFSLDVTFQAIEAGKLFRFQELVTRPLQWIKRQIKILSGDQKLKLDNFIESADGFVKDKMITFLGLNYVNNSDL